MVILSSGFIILLIAIILSGNSLIFDEDAGYFIFTLASIASIGGVLLLRDQPIGGILAMVSGALGASGFLLAWLWSALSSNPIEDLLPIGVILAGFMGMGGFLGLIVGPDLLQQKSKGLQDFLTTHFKEISEQYNVKRIKFWRVYSGGYGLLVNFKQAVDASDIKKLILYLQTNIYEKIFLISKSGLNQPRQGQKKYYIYKLEEQILQIEEKLINRQ